MSPQHYAAARMKVEGVSSPDIAVRLGVEERTVHLWFSDDKVKAEVEALVQRINEVFAEKMALSSMSALEQLTEMARMPLQDTTLSPEQKLAAIQELLDRTPQTARVPEQRGPLVNLNFQQLTDQELLAKARDLLGHGSDGNGAGPATVEPPALTSGEGDAGGDPT